MAEKSVVASPTSKNNIFQEMRETLCQKFSELGSVVNARKRMLDNKIDELEIEFNNRNKQIQKDKQQMLQLREYTQQQLNHNSLLEVQIEIFGTLAKKIKQLEEEMKLELHLTLDLEALKQLIHQTDVTLSRNSVPLPVFGGPLYTLTNASFSPGQLYDPSLPLSSPRTYKTCKKAKIPSTKIRTST